jgi:hypothetical protein
VTQIIEDCLPLEVEEASEEPIQLLEFSDETVNESQTGNGITLPFFI